MNFDWLWFQAFGPAVTSETDGLRKIKNTVTCQCLMAKRSSLLLAGAVNFYTCIFHLRRMLKGKKFKYKTACRKGE